MKKIIKIFYIILLVILLKLIISFVVNEVYIFKYKNGEYSEKLVEVLNVINFPESYVAPYNYGNLLYQEGKYAEAVKQYNIALQYKLPKEKECSIRINKALCILKSVDLEKKTPEDNIEILYKAREILCEKGCANTDNSNGHSKKAEKLKEEIDDLIEELKRKQEGKEEPEEKKKKESENPEKENEKEEKKKEELKKRQEEAEQERKKELEKASDLDTPIYSNYGKKNW